LLAAIIGWITSCFGESYAPLFICQEHSIFHSYRFNECFLFLLLRLVFVFYLDLCSDLVISFHQGVFGPLVHVGFHQKSCFKKGLNGVGKEKKLYAKSATKRSLCRLRLRLLHVMLDIILIVCLVIFTVA
jgi:hypothetical protein